MFSALPYDRLLLERAPWTGDRGTRFVDTLIECFQELMVPEFVPRVTPVLNRVAMKGEERG